MVRMSTGFGGGDSPPPRRVWANVYRPCRLSGAAGIRGGSVDGFTAVGTALPVRVKVTGVCSTVAHPVPMYMSVCDPTNVPSGPGASDQLVRWGAVPPPGQLPASAIWASTHRPPTKSSTIWMSVPPPRNRDPVATQPVSGQAEWNDQANAGMGSTGTGLPFLVWALAS